jgi:hypothetical protein
LVPAQFQDSVAIFGAYSPRRQFAPVALRLALRPGLPHIGDWPTLGTPVRPKRHGVASASSKVVEITKLFIDGLRPRATLVDEFRDVAC